MTEVVILSWDPGARLLSYVEVRSGSGGQAATLEIPPDDTGQFATELAGRDLLRTAELVIEDGGVLIDAAVSTRAVLCGVKAVGSPHDRQFELRAKGSRAVVARLPAASLGIADPGMASAAETLSYLYVETLTPPGCWVCEGGIDAWLSQKQDERAARELGRDVARADREVAERADRSFINPYTFVPFPARIARCAPPGHDRLGEGRLSGTFTVAWEFTSPFQAPEGASGTTLLRLPGSSVKGAVRSVHEALAGGCLRIFDDKFIPSYRDAATVRPPSWKLALVSEATQDGQPLTVQLCDDVVWVRTGQLQHACGSSLGTGSRITIDPGDVPGSLNSLGRKELGKDAVVHSDGDWVVLVTSPGTRTTRTGAYFLACGRLGQRSAEVSESAWRAFQLAAAGADDLRPEVRAAAGADSREQQPIKRVSFDSRPVGRRRVVTCRLWAGDVIWVRTRTANAAAVVADELSLAAIWRHPGWESDAGRRGDRDDWTAGRRVPDHLVACHDPGSLCPSCQVFGSADPNARGHDDRADQRAYAGHVRFGDACSDQPVELEEILRAPMGAPRPGAGQFYLAYDDTSPAGSRAEKPTREWGSAPDTVARRQLRGRKFYWHADPGRQSPPRHLAREHQKDGRLASRRWIAPPSTRLRQQVTFDNLSTAGLGGLLAAFEPQRVLPEPPGGQLRLHLGGGKPLGLGSCFATVSDLRAWSAESRYGAGPEIPPDRDAYVADFASDCLSEVTATWPALAAVLAEGTVDAARVWYPPGAYWSDQAGSPKKFDEPFAFFAASAGLYLKDKKDRCLIPLPVPGTGDQSLPITTEADIK